MINAGCSGTGSDYGAQRIDREVLGSAPDLVVVEFAVNDVESDPLIPMERIVRKIRESGPQTDVLFVYSLGEGDLRRYRKGRAPGAVVAHEKVAAHYGIPSVNWGAEVDRRVRAGALTWREYADDICHPNRNGSQVVGEILAAATGVLLATGSPGDHALPPSLTPALIVHPPAIPAEPLSETVPMAAEGATALRTWNLPIPGRQWPGEPHFAAGGARWALIWQPAFSADPLDATAGLSRATLGTGASWFEEAGMFVGPSHRNLAGGRGGRYSETGSNGREQTVLRFLPEAAGWYALEFGADSVGGYQAVEKEVGIHAVHWAAGEMEGRSVALHTSSRAEMHPFGRLAWVEMEPGDEVALVFLKKELGDAWYEGLWARAGWWGR